MWQIVTWTHKQLEKDRQNLSICPTEAHGHWQEKKALIFLLKAGYFIPAWQLSVSKLPGGEANVKINVWNIYQTVSELYINHLQMYAYVHVARTLRCLMSSVVNLSQM